MAAGSSSTKPAAKPRSPVERIIVWGVIGILLLLVGIEFNWRSSHVGAYEKCLEKIKETEVGDNTFKHKDVAAILGSKAPSKVEELQGKNISNGAKSVEIYTWPTLNPASKRELYVYYGHGEDPDVIGVGTESEQTVEEKFPPLTPEQLEAAKKNAPAGGAILGGPPPGMSGPPRGHSAEGAPADGDKPEGDKPAGDDQKPDEPAGDEKPAGEAAPADQPTDKPAE